MAVTAIWGIKGRLDKLINYTANPVKATENLSNGSAALHTIDGIIEYTADVMKTEKHLYVSGINCDNDPLNACRQFMHTKRAWKKTGGIIAFHGIQSFVPGEVDAKTAHEMGIELAEKLWGDRFEVLVSTHLNTGHFHNHFVINSVSYNDGHKYYDQTKTYYEMRRASDTICHSYKLNVIENPIGAKSKHYAQWLAEKQQLPTRNSMIRDDIDRLLLRSLTLEEFLKALKEEGYEIKQGKYLAVKPPGAERFRRLYKLGAGYSEDDLIDRILANYNRSYPEPVKTPAMKYNIHENFYKPIKLKGLQALYYHYLYLMGILPNKQQSNRKINYLYRQDIIKLDKISAETNLLCENDIESIEQLFSYKAKSNEEIKTLTGERQHLRYKMRAKITPERLSELKTEIEPLNDKLKKLRKEVKLCDAIEKRSVEITGKMVNEQTFDNQRKEKPHNELWQRRF